jgi:hypothetical protein
MTGREASAALVRFKKKKFRQNAGETNPKDSHSPPTIFALAKKEEE